MHSIRSGIDRLELADCVLKGRRVGLMTNPTGIDRGFRSTIDLLAERYTLTGLFAVEHGIRGCAQAGASFVSVPDPKTGIPVWDVYGANHRLTEEMLAAFDVLCFDIQDVGARFYTYLYALSFAMEECAKAGKAVVVLDRVNPIGGERIEGTVLDERFASYVGMYALPTRYGMTIGEYALWVKAHLGLTGLELTVIPLEGWHRRDMLCDLDLPWVAPSPNCASFHTALCYIGTCIFEGTNISEGRGTTLPFEYIGAPFIDADALEAAMAQHDIPGVHFRAAYFTPTFSKHTGEMCRGVQMHITDSRHAEAVLGALTLLDELRARWPEQVTMLQHEETKSFTIDKILGTDAYRLGKVNGRQLLEQNAAARAAFDRARQPFLLYEG